MHPLARAKINSAETRQPCSKRKAKEKTFFLYVPVISPKCLCNVEMNPGWSSRHMCLSCVCQGGVCCLFWEASAKLGSTREQKIKQDPFFRAFSFPLTFYSQHLFFLSLIRSPSPSLTPKRDVTSALFICSPYWNRQKKKYNYLMKINEHF